MNVSLSFYSEVGKRKNNEDAYSVLETADGVLAVVADGLGGRSNGEFASRQAIDTLNDFLKEKYVSADELENAVIEANRMIYELQKQHPGAMTTVAALWMDEQHAVAVHVGDTRIYQFRNGKIVFQTADHSAAQVAVVTGEIKAEELRSYKGRNKLTRALGVAGNPKVTIRQLDLCSGDRFLLCSDGFWEKIHEQEMVHILNNSENAEDWLQRMRKTVEPLATDNNTAIVIEVL